MYFDPILDAEPPRALGKRIYVFDNELLQCPIPNDRPYDISRALPITIFHPILAAFNMTLQIFRLLNRLHNKSNGPSNLSGNRWKFIR